MKISEEDQRKLKEVSEEYADYQYWMKLTERLKREKLLEVYKNVDKEVKTLPYHLKEEVTKKINRESINEFFPQQHEPALLYWE